MSKLEGMLWTLFATTATIVALLLPIHIILNDLPVQLGIMKIDGVLYDSVKERFANMLFRLYLLILIPSAVYFGIFRVKYSIHEFLGVKGYGFVINAILSMIGAFIVALGLTLILII